MATQDPDWPNLGEGYPVKLIAAIRRHLAYGPFRITARSLAIEANVDDATVSELLSTLASAGILRIEKRHICPCERKASLTPEQAAEEVCAYCERAFEIDVHGKPVEVTEFAREAPQTRDVRWMLALHGMNTQGAWQETFNWLVSRTYRRSVPVAIYKYGVVRPGAVIKFRQRGLIRGLNARIRRLSGQTEDSGFGGIPDVMAHSLGTWLLGHALAEDPTLRVGRVILLGCILRPDFDWELLLRRGQAEAVLCNVATKDFWALIAHYVIPDSGPSGRRGFNNRASISHAVVEGGHHSDFFNETEMPILFEHAWHPFLTEPAGQPVSTANSLPLPNWNQSWWPLRATFFRMLLLAIVSGFFVIALAVLALGTAELWRLLLHHKAP